MVSHVKAGDLPALNKVYNDLYTRDLIEDVKKETSGPFEDSLVCTSVAVLHSSRLLSCLTRVPVSSALLTPQLTLDAQILMKAMKGERLLCF